MNSLSRVVALALTILLPAVVVAQAPATMPPPPTPSAPPGAYQPAQDQVGSDASSQTYVTVKLGPIVPKHDDLQNYDNGFAVEAAIGYRFSPNAALEFSFGRFSLHGQVSGYVADSYGYPIPATATDDIVAYPVLVTIKPTLPLDKVELFGLIGGGMYFISSNQELRVQGYQPLTQSDSNSAFGFHMGGGVNIRLSPRALLGAEVKYVIGSVKLYDETGHFDSVMVGGTLTFHL